MSKVEFRGWPKMKRDNPFHVVITEKIDGTNACIIIRDGKIVGVQSRKRLITPEDDNFGFAGWVYTNQEELLKLGEGYHYGEWAGPGIQKNPHGLEDKTFFLFNTGRWMSNEDRPRCCSVVPLLHVGLLEPETVPNLLLDLVSTYDDAEYCTGSDVSPEGVCVYYPAFDKYTKHTIKSPNGKWYKEPHGYGTTKSD